jgi:methylmalonyl-CoA/ethylmalonyl-CoA epimerase
MIFEGLDHLAIAVPDTEVALKTWRDKFGFTVLYAEKVNNNSVLLTHLDLKNVHLQLVEPLLADSPLALAVKEKGSHLHHFCLKVADVTASAEEIKLNHLEPAVVPHQGTQGKRALFIQKNSTDNIQVELTGE